MGFNEVLPTIRKHELHAFDELLGNQDSAAAFAPLKEERERLRAPEAIVAEDNGIGPCALVYETISALTDETSRWSVAYERFLSSI